jgi:ABC-type proline/glycine betaine transport system permease subunit
MVPLILQQIGASVVAAIVTAVMAFILDRLFQRFKE